ncbi:MAG: hypothetical protein AAGA93_19050 [Actinomycetota bacterium]
MKRPTLAMPAALVAALTVTVAACSGGGDPSPPQADADGARLPSTAPAIAPSRSDVNEQPPQQRQDGLTVIATCDPCELELYTDFIIGGTDIEPPELSVYTRGSFAYWWDARFDSLSEARELAAATEEVQSDLAALGVGNPGAQAAGYFTNVFIHRGDDDVFPSYFGNGTGYEGDDENGGPVFAYLAYPFDEDLAANRVNLFHEIFHVFQGAATYDGVPVIDADGPFERAWIVEAMAEWYQMSRLGDAETRAFENVAAIAATPQLPLWAFFPRDEPAPDDGLSDEAVEALFYAAGIRQYSNGAFLYYLTDVGGIDPKELLDAMYLDLTTTPQELLFDGVGPADFRRHYTEWAVATTADFAYLDPATVALSRETFDSFAAQAPAGSLAPHAIVLDGADPSGTFSPDAASRPGAWAYNVVRIADPQPGSVSFTLNGDRTGDEGTSAHFDGAVLTRGGDGGWRTTDLTMLDQTTGEATVSVGDTDDEILVVVASVPERFVGDETYGYALTVTTS